MSTIDNLLYLPNEAAFADMMSGQIPRTMKARKVQDRGSLVIENKALEFRGGKGTVRLAPIRGLSHERWVKVEYGEGGDIRAAYISDPSKFSRKKNRELFATMQQELGRTPTDEAQDQELSQYRETARAGAAKGAFVRMWIGLAVAVIGIIVTVATLAAASEGGTYFVAYGAILFGGLAFLQGLYEWRKNRGA